MTIEPGKEVWYASVLDGAVVIKHGTVTKLDTRLSVCRVSWADTGGHSHWSIRRATRDFSATREEALDKLVQSLQRILARQKDSVQKIEARLQTALSAWMSRGSTGAVQ